MPDWVDRAVARGDLELERALAAQLARSRTSGPSRSDCIDCGDDIPPERQALGGVTRCVRCQTAHERNYRQ